MHSNHSRKHRRSRLILLSLVMILTLTACQKSTQFNYDPNEDPIGEVARVMNDLAVDYNPPVERMVIVVASLNDGTGLLSEHHSYDFSNISIQSSPGGKVVVSVPDDPTDASTWNLVRNINKTSSRPVRPQVIVNRADGISYDRLSFLIEPEMNSDTTFVLEDDLGNRTMTFRLSITGFTE